MRNLLAMALVSVILFSCNAKKGGDNEDKGGNSATMNNAMSSLGHKKGGKKTDGTPGPNKGKAPAKKNTKYALYDHFRFVRNGDAKPGVPVLINTRNQYYYIYKGESEVRYRKRAYELMVNENVFGYDLSASFDLNQTRMVLANAKSGIEYLKLSTSSFVDKGVFREILKLKSKNLILDLDVWFDGPAAEMNLKILGKKVKGLVLRNGVLRGDFIKSLTDLHTLVIQGSLVLKDFAHSTKTYSGNVIVYKNMELFKSIKTLKSLTISKMALDSIEGIGTLKDLEYLDICKTKIEKGASFSALGNLRKLKTLKICHHAPNVADSLKNYKQLKTMDLSSATFGPRLSAELKKLAHLEQLTIHKIENPQIKVFETVGQLAGLKTLSIGYDEKTDPRMFDNLGKLRKLRSLSLGDNGEDLPSWGSLKDADLSKLLQLKSLQYLSLGSLKTTGNVLPLNQNLRYLNLGSVSALTSESVKRISSLHDLRELEVATQFSDEDVKLLNSLKNLRVLALDGATQIKHLHVNGLKKLEALISHGAFSRLETYAGIKDLHNLKYLWLSEDVDKKIGIEPLKDLAGLQHLKLHLFKCEGVSLSFLKNLRSLEVLELYFPKSSEKVSSYLVALDKLVHLEISSSHVYGEKEISFLGKLKGLKFLNLSFPFQKDISNDLKFELRNSLQACIFGYGIQIPKQQGNYICGQSCGKHYQDVIFKKKKIGCGKIVTYKKKHFGFVKNGSASRWKIFDNAGKIVHEFNHGNVHKNIEIYKNDYLVLNFADWNTLYKDNWAIVDLKSKKELTGVMKNGDSLAKSGLYAAYVEKKGTRGLVNCIDLKKMEITTVSFFDWKKDDEDILEWNKGKLYLEGSDSTKREVMCPKK